MKATLLSLVVLVATSSAFAEKYEYEHKHAKLQQVQECLKDELCALSLERQSLLTEARRLQDQANRVCLWAASFAMMNADKVSAEQSSNAALQADKECRMRPVNVAYVQKRAARIGMINYELQENAHKMQEVAAQRAAEKTISHQ